MVSFSWKVNALNTAKSLDGKSDVVIEAHYLVICGDEEESVSAYGSVGFEVGDEFTSYDSLTESQVIGWVKDKLDVPKIQEQLLQALELKKNPPVIQKPLPWVSVGE
jgi:hypothetical protein